MAMVFCRGCGKEIHETAPTCPHCGALQVLVAPVQHVPHADAEGFFAYAFRPLEKYAVFQGRARRREYWYFLIFLMALNFVIGFMSGLFESGALAVVSALVTLATLLPSIAVGVRRMHDSNHSGWWLLLPLVNLVFLCLDSEQGSNRYGPSPKYSPAAAAL